MDMVSGLGWFAAALVLTSFYLKTISSLRLMAATSNVAFIIYALKTGMAPVLVLHALLLPLNLYRLLQHRRFRRRLRQASAGNAGKILMPHMRQTWLPAGSILFRKDDPSDKLYYIIDGRVALTDRLEARGAGELLGVMGVFTQDQKRLDTAIANTDLHIGVISTEEVREILIDEPELGKCLLQIISERAAKVASRQPIRTDQVSTALAAQSIAV